MNIRLLSGWKARFYAVCLTMLVSALAVTTFAGSAIAQEVAAPPATEAPAEAAAVEAATETVATAAATEEAAAEPAPTVDKGDVAWMLTSTLLVLLMVVPGLALFYGGMVRSKNVLSVLVQIAVVFSLLSVLWIVYGYSLAFSGDGAWVGNLDKLFLKGVTVETLAATFTAGVSLPEYVFIAFQLTFAGITGALIVGAFAERVKFAAVVLFVVIWFTLGYLPIAHMVWAAGGYLFEKGALDFAGGTVVHINAGIAGLVLALVVGTRIGFGKVAMRPHNVPLVMIGAGLLWFGWFGFNAGSELAADGLASLVWVNTTAATAAAILGWLVVEKVRDGHATSIGAASGVVAGLVAITPACGSLSPVGSLILGVVAGALAALAVGLKFRFGFDDSLDVVGVHLVAGLWGTVGAGLLATEGGLFYGDGVQQTVVQIVVALVSLVISGVLTFVIAIALKATMGWRIADDDEVSGIDGAEHAESGYDLVSRGGRLGVSSQGSQHDARHADEITEGAKA